jgi:hypothetical protein
MRAQAPSVRRRIHPSVIPPAQTQEGSERLVRRGTCFKRLGSRLLSGAGRNRNSATTPTPNPTRSNQRLRHCKQIPPRAALVPFLRQGKRDDGQDLRERGGSRRAGLLFGSETGGVVVTGTQGYGESFIEWGGGMS